MLDMTMNQLQPGSGRHSSRGTTLSTLGLLLRLATFPLVLAPTLPSAARAEEPPRPGHFYILAIEDERVFVDMGRKDGITTDMTLQVYKTGVTFDHPVSGEKVVGTTYLTDIKIVEVSDAFSIATPSAAVLAQLKPGYEVRFRPQDLEQVRSTRARLADLEAELRVDKETWEEKARREMLRYNNNNNKVSTTTEMVYFSQDDHYNRIQADFTYRLFRQFYAVRFGVGTLTGRGMVETYIQDSESQETGEWISSTEDVAFYYGYSDLELRVAPYFSLIPMFQLGLNNNGVGAGAGMNVRIGPELGTNLVISGGGARLVGAHIGLSFNHYVSERLYLSGRAVAENYVTGRSAPPAVRVLLGTHYDLTKKIQLDLGAGVGGRDINNMGPSASVGLSFNFPTGLWWMQELE